MPAIAQATAKMILDALTLQGSWVATVTGLMLRLTVNAPTAAVPGTELSGTGYTAGGKAVTFAAATVTSTGAQAASTSALTWTNGDSTDWTIAGMELWDQASTPVRKAYGLWDGQPLTIAPGGEFPVAAGAVILQIP